VLLQAYTGKGISRTTSTTSTAPVQTRKWTTRDKGRTKDNARAGQRAAIDHAVVLFHRIEMTRETTTGGLIIRSHRSKIIR
jgi:hypothetical protein